MNKKISSATEYIKKAPKEHQARLRKLRALIRKTAPKTKEIIKWSMVWYEDDAGGVCGFAVFKKHIGLFVTPESISENKEWFAGVKATRAVVHFPHDEPLPEALIKKLIRYRLKHGVKKWETKTRTKVRMPTWVRDALKEQGLTDAYKARPPYQRNDYLGWITSAKREETKQKRLKQMLSELKKGNVYMRMPWRTKKY